MHFESKVAVGFLTKLGVFVGALGAVLGPLSTVLDGNQTPEALGGLFVAASAFYGVIRSRGEQNSAQVAAQAAVVAAQTQAPAPEKTTGVQVSLDPSPTSVDDEEGGDAELVHDSDEHDEVIQSGGGENEVKDLHDRSDVPSEG